MRNDEVMEIMKYMKENFNATKYLAFGSKELPDDIIRQFKTMDVKYNVVSDHFFEVDDNKIFILPIRYNERVFKYE